MSHPPTSNWPVPLWKLVAIVAGALAFWLGVYHSGLLEPKSRPVSIPRQALVSEWWRAGMEPEIGITAAQARTSNWSAPDSVNVTHTQRGVREQWVYGSRRYLYFDDGVLTAIQEGR